MPKIRQETDGFMIQIGHRNLEELAILDLNGKLVADMGNQFWQHASETVVEEGRRKLLLNFSGLSQCDSFGISELLKIHQSLQNIGGKLVLFNVPDLIAKVFLITKVDTILNIAADEQAAISFVMGPALSV
jgi:anti-anti-sigma factor